MSAKDIIYDALSLWGTDSVVPARTLRAVRERHPEALERRPVTGGGPHAPVVRVDDIGTFCTRLAAVLPPPLAAAVLDYPKSKRCAEVRALIEAVSACSRVQPAPVPPTEGGGGGGPAALVRTARDQTQRDPTDPGSTLRTSSDDSCPTDDDASAEGPLPPEGADSAVRGPYPCVSDTQSDGTNDSDYAEQHERAAPNQRARRRRRRDHVATAAPPPPRRSKRQKRTHHAADDTQAAADDGDDGADTPESGCRHARRAALPSTVTSPLLDRTADSPKPAASMLSPPPATPAAAPPLCDAVATQDAHHDSVVTRLLSRATTRRPLCIWRWGSQRWRLALEAVPALQGIHWPWQVTYEAPQQGTGAAASATPPAGTMWIEWDDLAALVRRCLVSPHYMAVVSAARQVPLVDALGACVARDPPPYAIDGGLFNGADADADVTVGGITADDVACVLDGWVPAACLQLTHAQPHRCPMPLDLARRMTALAAAAAGTPHAARLHRLAATATAATDAA